MNNDAYVYYDEALGQYRESFPVDGYVHESVEERERKRQYAQREDARKRNTRHYVTSYHESVRSLTDVLEINELGAVMKIIPYMRRDKNGDLYDGPKRMGIAEIARAVGKSQRWAESVVKTLISVGVLTESRDGRRKVFGVNPEYHTMGETIAGARYTKVYQTKTKSDVRNLSVQAAGLLYCMIPFIHYERLYLVHNPDERDGDLLQHMRQADLAREIGVEEQTVTRGMKELSRHGFVMRSEAFGAIVIKMNPDVMYRKKFDDDDYTQSVRYEFEQNAKAADAFGITDESLPF
ncbi:replication/maintenance protein RepL [Paenibacillus sp. CAA11]|uniref:replication/maintenance protein RepL n=1 Tax=Paenibacillus sp. CAA11 TaxID=1532905 RepID=UPI00131EF945|nr:replication/maintenance protein RepL [Paenibacillus sp. CAA11]